MEEGRNALSIFFVKIFKLNQKKKDTVYMISVNHMATLTYILIHSWSYLLLCTSIKKKTQVFE